MKKKVHFCTGGNAIFSKHRELFNIIKPFEMRAPTKILLNKSVQHISRHCLLIFFHSEEKWSTVLRNS